MRDFTLDRYRALLEALLAAGYQLLPYEAYCDSLQHSPHEEAPRIAILRHDVDKLPENSLQTAKIEHALGVRATYYFRITAKTERLSLLRQGKVEADPQAQYISAIAALGHEVGYHYEDLSLAHGDMEKAYAHFQTALAYLRTFYPVRTICMHGAPMSKWDNKTLWQQYRYRDDGIIGEPYFDTPFDQVFYLTDTGRCWDGHRYSVRDKVREHPNNPALQNRTYHSTFEIIRAIQHRPASFPQQLMITTHPQRWTNNLKAWLKEWVGQSIKNQIKRLIILFR